VLLFPFLSFVAVAEEFRNMASYGSSRPEDAQATTVKAGVESQSDKK